MSEIQDLLNTSTQAMVDDYLIIDDNSREIYVPSGELLFGVTSDEKTERKYFQCPRIVGDNVDLTQYQLYINYQNANGEKDKYIVTDVKVVDDNITFTWLLSRKVTEYQGNISFIVCARNVDSSGNITNEWNTAIATGTCVVGLEVDDLTPGEQEQARDYFLQLEQELLKITEDSKKEITDTIDSQVNKVTNEGNTQVNRVKSQGNTTLNSIPKDYTTLSNMATSSQDEINLMGHSLVNKKRTKNGYALLNYTQGNRPFKQMKIYGNYSQKTTNGYNLFNPNDTLNEWWNNQGVSSDTSTSSFNEQTSNFIDLKDNTSIYIVIKYTQNRDMYYWVAYFDENKQVISSIFLSIGSKKDGNILVTNIPSNTSYFKVGYRKYTDGEIMVEYGSEKHDYEEYSGGKPSPNLDYPQTIQTVTALDMRMRADNPSLSKTIQNYVLEKELCKLPNGICDYIDLNKGKIIYNIKKLVLDGTQSFTRSQTAGGNSIFFYSSTDIKMSTDQNTLSPVICDSLPTISDYDGSQDNLGIAIRSSVHVMSFYLVKGDYSLTEWKQYLTEHNITVYYQLDTPVEEVIPDDLLTRLKELKTFEGLNTFVQFNAKPIYPTVEIEYVKDLQDTLQRIKSQYDINLGLNSIDNDCVGLEVDYENKKFTRLAGAVGLSGGDDFDKFPTYGGRKRCNVANDGKVNAYYGDSTFRWDGANGQVMVEQPKFYYLVVPLKTKPIGDEVGGNHLLKAQYYISGTPRPGFKLHPAFINEDGDEVDYIYIGAFEAVTYDKSSYRYNLNDSQTVDFDNDLLSSRIDGLPTSGLSQALSLDNCEKLAKNRGKGWHSTSIKDIAIDELLLMIEYASLNSQKVISDGVATITNDGKTNIAIYTGSTNSLGNKTGRATRSYNKVDGTTTYYTDASKTSMSYRGVENLWGNIWKHVQGLTVMRITTETPNDTKRVRGGQLYKPNDYNYTAPKRYDNYKAVDLTLGNNSGNVELFGYSYENDWLFVPTSIRTSGETLMDDVVSINMGADIDMCTRFGGFASSYGQSGMHCWHMYTTSTYKDRMTGTRLVYIPPTTFE